MDATPGQPEGADQPTEIVLPMPAGEVSAVDMLPAFRAYTEAMVAHAIAFSVAQGKPPSCRVGCDACCYQLAPVSATEARRFAAIVDAMPEPRRSAVRARFADADRRIGEWSTLAGQGIGPNNERQTESERLASYFSLGIPCPLLEDQRCSIYEERPLVCREYLVTSPAENCARLEEPGVVVDAIPRTFSAVALAHLLSDESPPVPSRVLLAQSLRWVAEHPQDDSPRRGAEAWLDRFFDRLRHVDELIDPPADATPESIEFKLDVPVQPVPARDMVPVFRAVTDVSVQQAIARTEARGKHVSCADGCSACCNQLVPIGTVEAHMTADLVKRLPEPRRGVILSRFAAAEARLAAWEHRRDLGAIDRPERLSAYRLGVDYFRLGISCPFLEDGHCSIHEQRPLACREYMVTSPAALCARRGDPATTIDTVPGCNASQSLAMLPHDEATALQRLPLTLALSWAATHPESPDKLPGRVWVERFVARLRGLR